MGRGIWSAKWVIVSVVVVVVAGAVFVTRRRGLLDTQQVPWRVCDWEADDRAVDVGVCELRAPERHASRKSDRLCARRRPSVQMSQPVGSPSAFVLFGQPRPNGHNHVARCRHRAWHCRELPANSGTHAGLLQ